MAYPVQGMVLAHWSKMPKKLKHNNKIHWKQVIKKKRLTTQSSNKEAKPLVHGK